MYYPIDLRLPGRFVSKVFIPLKKKVIHTHGKFIKLLSLVYLISSDLPFSSSPSTAITLAMTLAQTVSGRAVAGSHLIFSATSIELTVARGSLQRGKGEKDNGTHSHCRKGSVFMLSAILLFLIEPLLNRVLSISTTNTLYQKTRKSRDAKTIIKIVLGVLPDQDEHLGPLHPGCLLRRHPDGLEQPQRSPGLTAPPLPKGTAAELQSAELGDPEAEAGLAEGELPRHVRRQDLGVGRRAETANSHINYCDIKRFFSFF